MKKFSKRAVSLASVAAILASFAAMPVSAVESNVYSVSYETLTAAVTTADGDVVPAGSVAVTMSINNNTGFNANTLTLDIAEGYHLITNDNGVPTLQKGAVLANALASAAVSEDETTVCVAVASAAISAIDGALFTVYFTSTEETEGFVSIQSTDAAENAAAPMNDSVIEYYRVGDVTGDENVDANDATTIMMAVSDYGNSFNILLLGWDVLTYFPNARHYDAPDVNENKVIDNIDAADILDYAAWVGAGNTYTGNINRLIPFIR